MDKIKTYVDSMVENGKRVKEEIENYFPVHDFEDIREDKDCPYTEGE